MRFRQPLVNLLAGWCTNKAITCWLAPVLDLYSTSRTEEKRLRLSQRQLDCPDEQYAHRLTCKIECFRVDLPSAPSARPSSLCCHFLESLVLDKLKKANPTNGRLQERLGKASYGPAQKQAASPQRSAGKIAASMATCGHLLGFRVPLHSQKFRPSRSWAADHWRVPHLCPL